MICCPTLAELPPPPAGKEGWPWTEETVPIQEALADQLETEKRDRSFWPSISIVTPSYNQGRFIEETIRSILLQGYPKIELIIIDGGSVDESVRIIKKYSHWLEVWVSEPDRGQSHAINKGLRHSKGDIFNWINSDDFLTPGALYAVAFAWNKNPHAIISGRVIDFDEEGNEFTIVPNALSLRNFVDFKVARQDRMTWHQPGTFLPRAKVMEVGGVREDLEFNMDHFLMIDLLRRCDIVTISEVLARFRLHQDSKTVSSGHLQFRLERVRKLRELKCASDFITETELRQEYVALLLRCAAIERSAGFMRVYSYYTEALSVSPTVTIVTVIRQSILWPPAKVVLSRARLLKKVASDWLPR